MRRKIELNALLEISQAINANIPEEDLYRVFYFTCISNLQLSEIALYVIEEDRIIEKFSHELSFTTADLDHFKKDDFSLVKIKKLHGNISNVFKVSHKQKLLAVLFLGIHNTEEMEESYSFLQILSNIVMVAIENKRMARIALQQERVKKEVEIARNVQEMLIPHSLPNNDVLRASAIYLPHQTIGGDYYDVFNIGDHYAFCIADVSGKGVPAALIMSNFQASLRSLARVTEDLDEIVKDLNAHLVENARSDHFVTCFIGIYNPENKTVNYINAGHNAPVLSSKENEITLDSTCFMLGAFNELPKNISRTISIESGSQLFLYTDGVTETQDSNEKEYGEERLFEFLRNDKNKNLTYKLAELIVQLDEHKAGNDYCDDITMLILEFL